MPTPAMHKCFSPQIKAEDVGDLKKIVVRHDNSGLAAGWYLEEVGHTLHQPLPEAVHTHE